ncbi:MULTISPECIES: hypothetical protein [unclassified Mesorhizobium]|uniref:hypothetical protein n=1 Tax=unclassified Mesorhizobium TaxID=325217 RepID=UPI001126B2FF|nr:MULTISPECIES: hypothetical protein [unclassified Mesorhizobium]TPJ51749.1 hypothetical protein FJ426_18760 [Mesorhizobium sp. B2-6-4]TPN42371.1 hypothetical protein FJ979_02175 [Mesorhizobium sp. B1-1-6]
MSRTTITTASDPNTKYHDVCSQLEFSGWAKISCGEYASIWAHPDCPDSVLKVGHDLSDGWLDYAKSCTKTRSPHAPRIHAIELYENFFYAEIERLAPLSPDRYYEESLSRHPYPEDVPTHSLACFLRRTERVRRKFTDHLADYHENNFMVRPSTNEIVCTDPWC